MLVALVRRYVRPYAGRVTGLLVLQLLATLGSLYLPSLNADIVDQGVTQGDAGYILRVGAVMLAISLVQVACAVGAVYLGAHAATAVGRDVRRDLFDTVQGFSAQELARFGAPSLITRNTNDVQQVQMVVLMTFTIMVMAPIMLVGGVVMALQEDRRLSVLIVVVVPVLAATMGLLLWRAMPYFRAMQERLDVINTVLREQITGLRVVRAFVRERRESERFGVANTALYDTSMGAGMVMALAMPLVMLIMSTSQVAVLWFGAGEIERGSMQVGSLMAFLTYIMYILMAVMMSTMMFMMVPRAAVAAGRIVEVLETESSVSEPTDPVPLASLSGGAGPRGVVRFDDVEFRYPGADAPVLSAVSLKAEPGTVTAVIGSTGAGKTTLLNLVPRLFDVTAGSVSIDGVDVRDLATDDLGALLGLVPQKALLFSGTVASNLRYGRSEATEDEMWEALEVAQARDVVEALPDGLDAVVSQGGTTFSGGQRQRLAIARAVVRRPRVYLFDDSFSALDAATDARLRAALRARTQDATVLVVAQRVATIRDADQIIVLDQGRVVGRGTHPDLLATNETYAEIVASQMTLEEAS